MKNVTIILNNDSTTLEGISKEYNENLCALALYKSLELLTHHVRYDLGLPYLGGRSPAMVALQSDTDGQARDDGQPIVEEAKVLVKELSEAELKARAEALQEEAELLADEIGSELSELEPGDEIADDDDSDDDSETGDSDTDTGEESESDDEDEDQTDDHVDDVMEVSTNALEIIDSLVTGFKANCTKRQLSDLANLDLSKMVGYELCSFDDKGIVTFKLK